MSRQKSMEPIKTKKLDLRVTESEKERIHHAANKLGKKPTKWILETLLNEVDRVNSGDA